MCRRREKSPAVGRALSLRLAGREGRYGWRGAQAERLVRDALAAGMEHAPDAWQLLATSLLAQDPPDEARQAFVQLTRLQPGEPAHWLNLGNASLDCGDAEQAHAAFLRAGELGASGVPLLLGLGLAHLGCGRLLQAQALLSQAWRQEPQAADTSLAWAQWPGRTGALWRDRSLHRASPSGLTGPGAATGTGLVVRPGW